MRICTLMWVELYVVLDLECYLFLFSINYQILVQVITQFLKMETLLDDSVHQKVELQIERGGKSLAVVLPVSFSTNLYHNYD